MIKFLFAFGFIELTLVFKSLLNDKLYGFKLSHHLLFHKG